MTSRFRTLLALCLALAALPALLVVDGARADQAAATPRPHKFPRLLSDTGYFSSTGAKILVDEFVPYDVNVPFWNDGARKDRSLRVPVGATIGFDADGAWRFPTGTVFLQTVHLDDAGDRLYLETRVILQEDGQIDAATYVWNEEQSDAVLAEEADRFYALCGNTTQLWTVAERRECLQCHSAAAGLILGVNTRQLNRPFAYDDGTRNQIAELVRRGVLAGAPADTGALPKQVDPFGEDHALEARARSYIEVNCAVCHRPGGRGSGTLDLRASTALHETGLVKMTPDFELTAGTLVPGSPERSQFVARMRTLNLKVRMPNFLSTVPDDRGVELIDAWIRSK